MLELSDIKTKGAVQEALNNGKLRGLLREHIYKFVNAYKTNEPEHIEGTKFLNLFRCLYYNRKAYEIDALTTLGWNRLQQSITGKLWRLDFHKHRIFTRVYSGLYEDWKREEAKKLVKEEVIKEFFDTHPEYDNND